MRDRLKKGAIVVAVAMPLTLASLLIMNGGDKSNAFAATSVPRVLQPTQISMVVPSIEGDGSLRSPTAIPIQEMQFAASIPVTYGTGGPMIAKPNVAHVVLQLAESKASPRLLQALFLETNLGTVRLYVDANLGADFKVYTLSGTRVASESVGDSGGGASEKVNLAFTQVTESYINSSTLYHFGWNLVNEAPA
jgi:type VI protein secretion system component Hcp